MDGDSDGGCGDPLGRLLDAERRLSMNLRIVHLVDLEDLGTALVECDAIGELVGALIGGREGVLASPGTWLRGRSGLKRSIVPV